MDDVTSIWPEGLTETYWKYETMAPVEDVGSILFLGITFEPRFVVAAFIGGLLIWFFARNAFNKPSFEPASYSFRVLKELSPSDLRGQSQVRRAYGLYAGTLILIYVALTFFGKLILDLFNPVLNTAGLNFDAGSMDFESPQWPITISLGMIGLIPMLKPVDVLERRIRRWTHERAGIPVHIHQRSADFRKGLDNMVEREVEAKIDHIPDWVHQAVNDPRSIRRIVEAVEELSTLRNWLMDERAHWPSAEQRQRIGHLERAEIEESDVVLDEFWALLAQDFDTHQNRAPSAAHLTEDQLLLAHRNHLIAKWKSLASAIEHHRDELIAILVVYGERDENYVAIEDPRLERLVANVFVRDAAPPGPGYAIAWSLVLVFAIYVVAVTFGWHPLLGSVPLDTTAVLWTAALETARVAILFWAPVGVVMANRATKWEQTTRSWTPMSFDPWQRSMGRQLLGGIAWAIGLSVVALCLLAILWAALVSRHPERFVTLLTDGSFPFLWTFPTLAGVAVAQIVAVMFVVDAPPGSRIARGSVLVGLASAAVVIAWKAGHFVIWLKSAGFSGSPLDLFRTVVLQQDMVNLAVYGTMAFCSVTIFVPRRRPDATATAGLFHRAHAVQATAAAVIAAALFLAPERGLAASQEATATGPKTVNVGFRSDAEPFSFLIERNGEERYSGYLASLCYKIFSTNRYQVNAVGITAQNRFPYLQGGTVDMLCDPITLRYSLGDGREDGIFSPIVFVTGVSYMRRQPTRNDGPMMIGYVDATSARQVAERACEIDHFRWAKPKETLDPDRDCRIREAEECWIGERFAPRNAGDIIDEPAHPDGGEIYRICRANDHEELIAWFCSDDREGSDWAKAYFGDQDIIRGNYEAWLKAGGECADVEQNPEVYTYEPYALLISKKPEHVELVAYVQQRIYEIFSNRPEALGLFIAHFPDKQMSRPLASLFLLNGVERQECMQFNQGEKCEPGRLEDDASSTSEAPLAMDRASAE